MWWNSWNVPLQKGKCLGKIANLANAAENVLVFHTRYQNNKILDDAFKNEGDQNFILYS